jgi:aminoglycoside phosphotransferase (APT) family kinase protein
VSSTDSVLAHLAGQMWRNDEVRGHLLGLEVRQRRDTNHGVTIVYEASVQVGEAVIEQLYVGYQVAPRAFRATLESLARSAGHTPAVGRAIIDVPQHNLVLLAFPNDRKLRLLPDEALRDVLARRVGLKDARIAVLRYMPEKRLTLRCRGIRGAADGRRQPFSVIVKQYSPRRAAAVYRTLAAVWKSGVVPGVRVPKVLGFDRLHGLVLMEDLPGRELKRALPEIDSRLMMTTLGRTMAAFHQLPARVRRRATYHSELQAVSSAVRTIGDALPALRARLRTCRGELRRLRPEDAAPAVLLHGACRLKHVLIDAGNLALYDLDGVCVGHPAYDLGNFVSSLYYLEQQERFDAAARQGYARHFLGGYTDASRLQVRPAVLLWYLAARLLHKQAAKYVTHLHDDRDAKVIRMVGLAEAALAGCRDVPPDASLIDACQFLSDAEVALRSR